ncbi:hypothetical protein NN6n1_32750 [Shinella zoogloeoides]
MLRGIVEVEERIDIMDTTLSSEVPAGRIETLGQPWKSFLLILLSSVLLTSFVVVLDRIFGIDNWNIVRDPNAIAGQPAYFGFYSGLGAVLWLVAGSSALLAARCLRRTGRNDPRSRLLLLGGLFCTIAGLDDFLMLHEQSYLIGIPEKAVMAAYAVFLLVVAATAYPVLRLTNWIYFSVALVCLGGSALVDMADLTMSGAVLLEETLKFTGIAYLAAYLVTLAVSTLAEAIGRAA